MNTLWLNFTMAFGWRGRQEHCQLLWGDILLKKTANGQEYLTFQERLVKTRNGGKGKEQRMLYPKIFSKPGEVKVTNKLIVISSLHKKVVSNIYRDSH